MAPRRSRSSARRASKGCVRLHPSNAAVLFALVQQHGPANTRILIEDLVTRVAQR